MKNMGDSDNTIRLDEIIREVKNIRVEVPAISQRGGNVTSLAEQGQLIPPEEDAMEEPKKRGMGTKIVIAFASFITICLIGVAGYTYLYPYIFPGVMAGTASVGGMQVNAAAGLIGKAYENLGTSDQVLKVLVADKEYMIDAKTVTGGVDAMNSARNAYQYGRMGGPLRRVKEVFTARLRGASTELNLAVDEKSLKEKLRAFTAETMQEVGTTTYELSDNALILNLGNQGIAFDREAVEEALADKLRHMDFSPYTIEAQITDPQQVDFAALKEKIDCEPQDAIVDKTTGKIVPDADGLTVELANLQSIVGSNRTGTFTIPVVRKPAKVSASDLERVLFRDELAATSTKVTSNADRTNNVRLAASLFNGTILNPGDEFSYNGTVGQRTIERGFKEAGAYVQGRVVDEVGGGVCQPSSTLYMAALRADLAITERHNHTYVSSYTPFGEDAMVSWNGPDFKMVNNTDYPIKIEAEQTGAYMKIRLLGTKISNKTVTTHSDVLSKTPYETVYKEDPTIPSGSQKVDQTGSIGYKTVTYKIVTENGVTTKIKVNSSNYRKRDKIILVHPGEAQGKKPTTVPATVPVPEAPEEETEPVTTPEDSVPQTDPEAH